MDECKSKPSISIPSVSSKVGTKHKRTYKTFMSFILTYEDQNFLDVIKIL